MASPSQRRHAAKIKGEGVNDVWCVDLVFDATRHGVTLKFLTIVDEGSHDCIDIAVGRRMSARDVARALDEAVRRHDRPRHLRSDNGGEFIAEVLQRWLEQRGVVARFIEPGGPWQNGVCESFNDRFRDEYNDIRPHRSLDPRAPSARSLPRPTPRTHNNPYPPHQPAQTLAPRGPEMCVRSNPGRQCLSGL